MDKKNLDEAVWGETKEKVKEEIQESKEEIQEAKAELEREKIEHNEKTAEEIKEKIEDVKENIEEVIEEVKGNSEEVRDNSEEVIVKKEGKGLKFFKKILGGIIDQIISIALALLLLIVTDLLLKLFGLDIAQREPMFLIMYIIVNIVYAPICTSTKLNDTIGRKTVLK